MSFAPKGENQRIKLSKMLLKQALIDLLQEKPLDKVTIKELCMRADINPSTFYANYIDKLALLNEIENDYLSELTPVFNGLPPQPSVNELSERFELLILHFIQHRAMHFALYTNKQLDFFERIAADNRSHLKLWNIEDRVPSALENCIYTYAVYGCISMLHHWAASGEEMPPGKIAELLAKITVAEFSAVFGGEKNTPPKKF